MSVRTLVTGQN